MVITFLTNAQGLQADQHSKQEELLILEEIKETPSSEAAHYKYATFLLLQDRYKDAENEARNVLMLNADNKLAKELLIDAEALSKTTDPMKREERKLNFTMRSLDHVTEELSEVMKGFDSVGLNQMEAKREQRKEELDEKYQISEYRQVENYNQERLEKQSLITKYNMANKYEKAEALHKELVEKFPKSESVIEGYVGFLFQQKRYSEAQSLLATSLKKFSKSPPLRIYRDGINTIQNLKSSEQRENAHRAVLSDVMSAASIATDQLMKHFQAGKSLAEK